MRLFNRALVLTVLAFAFLLFRYLEQVAEKRAALKNSAPVRVCELPREYAAGMEAVGVVEYELMHLVLAAPMPKSPLKDQQKPPCDSDPDLEVEVRGGCWIILGKKPPCGKTYDYNHPSKGAICLAPKKAAVRPNEAFQREP